MANVAKMVSQRRRASVINTPPWAHSSSARRNFSCAQSPGRFLTVAVLFKFIISQSLIYFYIYNQISCTKALQTSTRINSHQIYNVIPTDQVVWHRRSPYVDNVQATATANDGLSPTTTTVLSSKRQPRQDDDGQLRQLLPNGPPPFRPSPLLVGLSSTGILGKFKRTQAFKRIYKSKVYYLFLDVLQQLSTLVNQISKKKIELTSANVATIQATVNKWAWKNGYKLKLKWPLAMLNPLFIREFLANPTFLVMLFHAIEVAYMSMPVKFWLKPLVRLVKQPGPEKEEEIWWRRKRLYDTLNGHGASEWQPNLKTVHFRNPGKQTPIAFPHFVNRIRELTGRQVPLGVDFTHPVDDQMIHPPDGLTSHDQSALIVEQNNLQETHYESAPPPPHDYQDKFNNDLYMSSDQEEAFLANQVHYRKSVLEQQQSTPTYPHEKHTTFQKHSEPTQFFHHQNYLHHAHQFDDSPGSSSSPSTNQPSEQEQIMNKDEFDLLDPQERELVLQEAQRRLEESRLTNELINHQNNFVKSFADRPEHFLSNFISTSGMQALKLPQSTVTKYNQDYSIPHTFTSLHKQHSTRAPLSGFVNDKS